MKKTLSAFFLVSLCSYAAAQSCGALDLVLVLDSSSQVGPKNFQAQVNFALSLIVKVGLSNTTVNVAGVEYGDVNQTEIFLNLMSDPSTAVVVLNNLTYFDSGSAPGNGLYLASTIRGWRSVPKVVLLLSGSFSTEGYDTLNEAAILRQQGAIVFAIGAGKCDTYTLHQAVSNPANYYYFNSFSGALDDVSAIASAVCHYAGNTASSTSPYTNTGGGVPCGGDGNICSIGAQCCSDSTHPGSDFYCCPGAQSCCYGSCCTENSYCNLGTCTSGPSNPTFDPYTTTSGSVTCGYNYCVPGAQCCSDDNHPGSDMYCCSGSATCCLGQCCNGQCNLGSCQGEVEDFATR